MTTEQILKRNKEALKKLSQEEWARLNESTLRSGFHPEIAQQAIRIKQWKEDKPKKFYVIGSKEPSTASS